MLQEANKQAVSSWAKEAHHANTDLPSSSKLDDVWYICLHTTEPLIWDLLLGAVALKERPWGGVAPFGHTLLLILRDENKNSAQKPRSRIRKTGATTGSWYRPVASMKTLASSPRDLI